MFRSIIAILAGYVAASVAAGLTQVLFVIEPSSVLASRESALATGLLVAMAATQAGTFALPFAIIAIGLTETFGWRGWLTYGIAGLFIGLCGYWTVVAGEEPGVMLRHTIALRAFALSGAIGGLVYWLAAGRRGSRRYY